MALLVLYIISLTFNKINSVPSLENYDKNEGEKPHWATGTQDFSVRRWYVDKDTATCLTFTYLGNGGNANNFSTQDECKQHLKFNPEEHIYACNEGKPTGLCSLAGDKMLDRWYFKKSTTDSVTSGVCELFKYNGCGGNANNFLEKSDCLKACQNNIISNVSAVAPTGTPEGEKYSVPNDFDCLVREQVDTEDPVVKIVLHPNSRQCIYGAIKKSAKRGFFKTFQECVAPEKQIEACKRNGPDQMLGTGDLTTPDPIKERYYYDKKTQMCIRFHSFAKKDGSSDFKPLENRFSTLEMCLSYCPAIKQPNPTEGIEVCALPKAGEKHETERINGILDRIRFFYNNQKTPPGCEKFTYGGLNGNHNNFESIEDCQAICETPLKAPE